MLTRYTHMGKKWLKSNLTIYLLFYYLTDKFAKSKLFSNLQKLFITDVAKKHDEIIYDKDKC